MEGAREREREREVLAQGELVEQEEGRGGGLRETYRRGGGQSLPNS